MRDSKPCNLCGTEVPFQQAIFSHAIDQRTGKVLWLCSECRQIPFDGIIPADQCDQCKEWKPREDGRPMFAPDACGDLQEVLWLCPDCAKPEQTFSAEVSLRVTSDDLLTILEGATEAWERMSDSQRSEYVGEPDQGD